MKKMSTEYFNSHLLNNNKDFYVKFEPSVSIINISDSIYRKIHKNTLHYSLNTSLVKKYLSNVDVNKSAKGFVKNKSYFDFLSEHIDGKFFLRLDVKDFFHSIDTSEFLRVIDNSFSTLKAEESHKFTPASLVKEALTVEIDEVKTVNNLTVSVKKKRVIPKGFPSSPIISNILFRKIDILIQKYCDIRNITYTRYADDLLFSAKKSSFVHGFDFLKEIKIYLKLLGLKLNNKKTNKSVGFLSLNGYFIENRNNERNIRITNKKLNIINDVMFYTSTGKTPEYIMRKVFDERIHKHKFLFKNDADFFNQYCKSQIFNKIVGYRSFMISIIKYDDCNHILNKKNRTLYLSIIDEINLLVEQLS